jgi:hypothetical protein
MNATATLLDWKIEDNYGTYRLVGTIIGKDTRGRFQHGERIFTSPVKSIDFETGIAKTMSGSIYKLIV